MKNALFLMIAVAVFAVGCDIGSSKPTSMKKENCIEPLNPYNDGGGHDAGFNWARENGGNCDGRSDSFNDGCSEYYRQLTQYNECIAKSRN